MAYASQSGRARTNPGSPQAHAICDRCGFRYNFVDLSWQFDIRGPTLQNIRVLVCRPCYDTPQENIRSIVLPADPTPITNARIEYFVDDETTSRTTSGQDTVDFYTGIPVPGAVERITQANATRVTNQTGAPNGTLNPLPGTDINAPGDAHPGLPYNNTYVPQTGDLGPLPYPQFGAIWLEASNVWLRMEGDNTLIVMEGTP